MSTILRLILSCAAIGISAWITPGVSLPELSTSSGMVTLLMVALVLALLNTFIKPIIKLLALPVTVLTLGLFVFVINALIIMLCSWFVDGFFVEGFASALVFSMILSVVSWLLNKIF